MEYRVSDITIYPIKSLAGISMQSAKALKSGFELDRRWLLVDSDNVFISQRTVPIMAQYGVKIQENHLVVYHKQQLSNQISIPFELDSTTLIKAIVWDDEIPSFVYNNTINDWFSRELQRNVRLVKMQQKKSRIKHLAKLNTKTELSYADGYPYLVLSRNSVEYISNEIGEDIDIRQFRANIIIEASKAFDEDNMEEFSTGTASFVMVKPCKRCQVIGLDQDTGISSKQPIKFLAHNRKVGQHIHFGMNAALTVEGEVNIGDKLIF